MNRRYPALLLLCVALATTASAASPNVVISQVYGGGGNSGATYRNDFIELFNRGTSTVSLTGWSVQYASSAGTTWAVTPLSGSIEPGQYYLVQQSAGAGGTVSLPAPDAIGSIAMSATAGKVALVSSTAALTGACPAAAAVDFVGFGSANCSETAPTPTLSNTTAALRASNGCTDSDNNSADFATGAPNPRNRASSRTTCAVSNAAPTINPPANPIATVTENAAPFDVSLTGSDDNGVYNWAATPGSGIATVTMSGGQGTATATFRVTLQTAFAGTASFTASLSDGVNAGATQAVNIAVTNAPPPPLDHVVISQIYGGGGNSGATYRNDYVELYNATTAPVDLGGWSIQYASATGTSWQVQPLGGVVGAGEYYLIALGSGGATGALVPDANVTGDINMSATTGKVALVRSGEELSGCPTGNPLLVDLVGFGTANCREGAANAPGGSNTTAMFRKNGGLTDTNVNGSDFQTGTPNPRRTTPIQEIGPAVLNVDPRRNATSSPRDASISITFTEPVSVDTLTLPQWFNIACQTSGLHNETTVAAAFSSRTWIITPNANFLAGETCTVTIRGTAVRDLDLDDSAPNTDTLPADYSWSFTVVTGTEPPYPPGIHLAMGNPSNASADVLAPANFLMMKPEFALSYNRNRGTANWVSWHLADEWVGTLSREDTFRPDPAVPADWYRVLHIDYQGSGFDRGHMVPSADRDKETSTPINQATFLMTNMIPQSPDNNQGPWANLENYLRTLLPANELYVVAGGAGTGGAGSNGPAATIANGKVTVPAQTWKVALVLPKAAGDDVRRVTAAARTIAVIMPNVQGIRTTNPNDWHGYLTTVDAVENLTGYDFFANVGDAVENAIEAGVDGVNPPGAANLAVSTDEDTARSFTLDAAAAAGATLTYSVVSGPSKGTLSGSGLSVTYTPAPNFYGSDSFTFRVSDGARQSNLATVSITVHPVNDAPAVDLTAPATTTEGSAVTAVASASDVENDALTYGWSVTKDGAPFAVAAQNGTSFGFTPDDNGVYVITANVSDEAGAASAASTTVTVVNAAPAILSVTGPSAHLGTGETATISVAIVDAGSGDTHTANFIWDDGTSSMAACGSGACTAAHAFAAAGVYTVTVVVTDDDGGSASSSFEAIIVADPSAGSVTGGGFFETPAGRAMFNVGSRYLKNAAAPSGNTQLRLGASDFDATSQRWLVVSGARAQYAGEGTLNRRPGYAYVVTVEDGEVDRIRFRIWDKATGAVVFDNAAGAPGDIDTAQPQAISGGSIQIHR